MTNHLRKIFTALLLLLAVIFGLCVIRFALLKEKMIDAYLDQGEPCNYGFEASEEDVLPSAQVTCKLLPKPLALDLVRDVDSSDLVPLVQDLVRKDFPGYIYVPSGMWRSNVYDPTHDIKAAGGGQMGKEVWLCSDPAAQPLTAKTSVLALCAFVPNVVDNGYGSVINIYEFRQGPSGAFSRRLFREAAYSSSDRDTNVVFSLSFAVFNQKLLATIEKHQIYEDRQIKKYSSLWVYRDKSFQSLLDFESFAEAGTSGSCNAGAESGSCSVKRWLPWHYYFIKDGTTVFFSESWGNDTSYGKPSKEIPFIFDAKNWTLKRKYPLKPGETF